MQKISSFFKHHKRFFQCAFLCALAFCVFASVWYFEIRGQGKKSLSWALNDQFHDFVPIENQLTQDFRADRDILALSFVLAAQDANLPPEGDLELIFTRSGSDEVLARSTGNMKYILNGKDGYYTTLGLDAPVELPSAGSYMEYSVTLIPHYLGEGRLAVGFEPGGMPAGIALTVDGDTLDGTIALKAVQMRIGGFLTIFYWAIALICIALLAISFWLFTCKKVALHWLVFTLVLVLGFLFNMVMPPYSAPDERFHINQSFSLASTIYDSHLFLARTDLHSTLKRPSDQNALVEVDSPTVFTWKAISRELNSRNYDEFGDTMSFPEQQVESNYNLYWPSAFGVLIGYLLRLGFVPTLFLGRMMNLLLFAVFSMLAVKITPVAKQVFALISLLPMTLHLAASYSRDCVIMAVTLLFIALILDASYGPHQQLSWPSILAISLLGGLLLPAKIVYIPIVLLLFLIPGKRLPYKAIVVRLAMILICLSFLFTNVNTRALVNDLLSNSNPSPAASAVQQPENEPQPAAIAGSESTPLQTDFPVEEASQPVSEDSPAAAADAADTVYDDSVCFSIYYVLGHPIETIKLCITSLLEHGEHYVRTLVGGTLGYFNLNNDLNISWVFVILLYVLLTLGWLCPQGLELTVLRKSLLFFVGLASCGLVVLGCILWTPTYYTSIYGLQGRYFLPALPLLLLARPVKLSLAQDCSRGLVWSMGILDLFILLNAFLAVVSH